MQPSKFCVILPNAPITTRVTVIFFSLQGLDTDCFFLPLSAGCDYLLGKQRQFSDTLSYSYRPLQYLIYCKGAKVANDPFVLIVNNWFRAMLIPLFSTLYVDLFAETPMYCFCNVIVLSLVFRLC